ncbi:MAG: RNA-binding protein [Thermoplasmata archaeon]|nr:MAG: RNA-binding protein [Thermoplasmata archaeon]
MEQIFVGNKDISKYITACLTALQKEKELKISARGRNIKRAVDVEEIVKRYMKKPEVTVELGTDKINDRFVSTIDIVMKETG